MPDVELLSIIRLSDKDRAQIEAVDPAVRLTDAGGWYDGEIRETWPEFTSRRYLATDAEGEGTREQRDELLANAEVVLGGWPFPLDLRRRTPKMKWFHQRPAGASNLRLGDLWGSDVLVTTSRGYGATLPIAEYALTGIMHFAKGLHRVELDRAAGEFDHRQYKPVLLEGKTVCVVGTGGIGRDVGKLCAAVGMRVVGTKRRPPDDPSDLPEGYDEIRGADGLLELLAESDFVAVCCQWTEETTGLIGTAAFEAMKPGAVVVNVARGEIVDEDALVAALAADKIRGAALDVYVGEFEGLPDERLWADPRVLITPHTSNMSDVGRHRATEIFCENLAAYVEGRPLANVIDWEAGY